MDCVTTNHDVFLFVSVNLLGQCLGYLVGGFAYMLMSYSGRRLREAAGRRVQ